MSRPAWLSPRVFRTEVLAGLVVAIALIPEAISFSILAGVDPRVGLFASFTMAVTIAFTGGRPAMMAATASAGRVRAKGERAWRGVACLGIGMHPHVRGLLGVHLLLSRAVLEQAAHHLEEDRH